MMYGIVEETHDRSLFLRRMNAKATPADVKRITEMFAPRRDYYIHHLRLCLDYGMHAFYSVEDPADMLELTSLNIEAWRHAHFMLHMDRLVSNPGIMGFFGNTFSSFMPFVKYDRRGRLQGRGEWWSWINGWRMFVEDALDIWWFEHRRGVEL